MREPLSDDEVKRIARATAHETVKRIADVGTILALSIVGIMLLPALLVMAVNSFEPPLGHEESPLMGAFFALTFAVVAAVLVRTWASLRRG